MISKIRLSGWIAERTDSRNLALDSVWLDSSTISQSGFSLSELLPFGLSRFCPSLSILKRKLKNFATVQVMFESLHAYTWATLLWNFSKFWSNKILAESPLTERSLKFHWPPFCFGASYLYSFLDSYTCQLIFNCIRLFGKNPCRKGIN